MKNKRNWVVAVIITASAGVFALQKVSAPLLSDVMTGTPLITSTTTAIPLTSTPTYETCAFMWAYHDDPDLSVKLNKAIHSQDSSASANAQLYGEDCVYADGHSTFGAMETDFYIRLPVEDLSPHEKLGNWMKQGLDIVNAFPKDQIQGSKGFVEFSFSKTETEQIVIRVDINEYLNNNSELSGMNLFQKYYMPPDSNPPAPATSTP